MNKLRTIVVILIVITATVSVAGQEKNSFVSENDLNILLANSRIANVINVDVVKLNNTMTINGKVKRKLSARSGMHSHGLVHGYVDIEILNANGESISRSKVKPSRISKNDNIAKFKFETNKIPEIGSMIKISHGY